MSKCEYCQKDYFMLDIDRDKKVFCNQNCLNEYKKAYFNYNIEEYIQEHLDEIAQEYKKELKDIVSERY